MTEFKLFDAHFHVIDPRFPLVPNQGFVPERYTLNDYRDRLAMYSLCGGALVSGSFQAFDQDYLVDALSRLGPQYAGVTQLPVTVSDEELVELNNAGVRGVRFNLERGGSEDVKHLDAMARRLFEIVGWHVELYVDAKDIGDLFATLVALPAVSIDHLGLSAEGLPTLLKLAEQGVRVKASGFGRVNLDVRSALKDLYAANPACLMFGTDLPSARASRPYSERDFRLVIDTLGEQAAQQVLSTNALGFYRVQQSSD
jgi:predicted TIM-barrel fold metal-dependent hydrolase